MQQIDMVVKLGKYSSWLGIPNWYGCQIG